jgi:hypothetical protein
MLNPFSRNAARQASHNDVAPDGEDVLAGRRSSFSSGPDRGPRSEDELARFGYSGQDYPIYGQPHIADSQAEEPEPGWFGDAAQVSAYAFGYTTSMRPEESAVPGGHAGKGPKGYTRADARVLEDICDRLSEDDELDSSDISVRVTQGEVWLEGSVADRFSKRRAVDIAGSVRGVVDVHTSLKVHKGAMAELADKLVGGHGEHHGHHGSGTRG